MAAESGFKRGGVDVRGWSWSGGGFGGHGGTEHLGGWSGVGARTWVGFWWWGSKAPSTTLRMTSSENLQNLQRQARVR